jgi:hypothetical protein
VARQFGKHVPEGLLRGNLRRIGRTQLFRHRDVEPRRGVPVASLPVSRWWTSAASSASALSGANPSNSWPDSTPLAARPLENTLQATAVFELDGVESKRPQHFGDLLHTPAGHHAVQTLPVQVDHPQDPTQVLQVVLAERLPDVALVQFRIAHQGDETVRRARSEVILYVLIDERHEVRCHDAQTNRPGGKVEPVGITQAAWIGLQSAELAQLAQFLPLQVAEQVLDCVVNRRSVRLNRNEIPRSAAVK